MSLQHHQGPWWLPGGNAQTIWPALHGRRFPSLQPRFERERWTTPDGDFVDVDFLRAPDAGLSAEAPTATRAAPPLLVLFHGLEGSSSSHYAIAFAAAAQRLGWHLAVPHFRGCSGEINLAPRAYHCGDFEEVGWMLERFRAQSQGPLVAAGVSLGGNALLRWAQESGASASRTVKAVAAISAPLDMHASGQAIGRGFNRLVYTRMFLRTMKPRALIKLQQYPGLFDREALLAAQDLYAFDDVFTGPLHGFRGVDDYWTRGSSKPHLARLRLPSLVVNALNDPFVPGACLPTQAEVSDWVSLWQPKHGGHVGFAAGLPPGHVLSMPEQVTAWMAMTLGHGRHG